MKCGGDWRNAVYKVKIVGLPDGKKTVKSKVPGEVQQPASQNQSFYRFGSRTNIRSSFDIKKDRGEFSKTGSIKAIHVPKIMMYSKADA